MRRPSWPGATESVVLNDLDLRLAEIRNQGKTTVVVRFFPRLPRDYHFGAVLCCRLTWSGQGIATGGL
jgi:hypothetical protein